MSDSNSMIRIALAYFTLVVAVVVAADAGWLPNQLEWLHDLPFCDKVLHFVLFGLLALVANLALASYARWPLARAIVIGSILVLIVATAEEYSNQWFPRRDWSLGDLLANYLGVFALGLLPMWQRPLFSRVIPAGPDDSPGPQNAAAR